MIIDSITGSSINGSKAEDSKSCGLKSLSVLPTLGPVVSQPITPLFATFPEGSMLSGLSLPQQSTETERKNSISFGGTDDCGGKDTTSIANLMNPCSGSGNLPSPRCFPESFKMVDPFFEPFFECQLGAAATAHGNENQNHNQNGDNSFQSNTQYSSEMGTIPGVSSLGAVIEDVWNTNFPAMKMDSTGFNTPNPFDISDFLTPENGFANFQGNQNNYFAHSTAAPPLGFDDASSNSNNNLNNLNNNKPSNLTNDLFNNGFGSFFNPTKTVSGSVPQSPSAILNSLLPTNPGGNSSILNQYPHPGGFPSGDAGIIPINFNNGFANYNFTSIGGGSTNGSGSGSGSGSVISSSGSSSVGMSAYKSSLQYPGSSSINSSFGAQYGGGAMYNDFSNGAQALSYAQSTNSSFDNQMFLINGGVGMVFNDNDNDNDDDDDNNSSKIKSNIKNYNSDVGSNGGGRKFRRKKNCPRVSKENRICSDCSTRDTPIWRYSEDGRLLCNACGVYAKKNKQRRSVNSLKRKKPANIGASSSSTSSSSHIIPGPGNGPSSFSVLDASHSDLSKILSYQQRS